MEPQFAQTEISHKTAVSLERLRSVVTKKRFLQLTDNTPIENLSQDLAVRVEAHLTKLSDWYTDFNNITMAALEGNQIEPVTNPRAAANLLVPQLIDRLSHDFWNENQTPGI